MFVVLRKRLAWQAAFFFALVYPAYSQLASSNDLAGESHRARELMAEHRFSEALPIYEKLVKALPGSLGLLLNLALAQEMSGHPAQSVPNFEVVLKSQPDSVPALVSLAMARLQLNQPREAIPLLRKLIKLDPADRNALGMLADAELSVQQFEPAAQDFRQLTVEDAGDPRAWYGLGKAYEALSAQTFNRLNAVAPESPYVATLLADTRVQRHQYRSAFFFYREAQGKLPDLPGIHAGLAQVYRNTDHAGWAEAEQKREQTLSAPDCRTYASECSFLAGRFLEAANSATGNAPASTLYWATKAYNQLAIDAFDQLSRLPESVQGHALRAQILHDHKQDMEAANEWKAALKLAPNDAKLKRQLAAALFNAKDYQGAIPLLEGQLAVEPNSPELNYLLGASLFRTEQPEKALPHLELGVQGHSDILPAEAALGLTLIALSKNAEAIPHLKKALALDDDGSLHYSLARAYKAAGDAQLASETIRQYQQIQKQNQEINGKLETEAEITAPAR